MDDTSYWMFYVAAGFSAVSVVFTVWVAYSVMQTQAAIDELETLVLAVLDDALQIMVPTSVLNHISQYDIANFEMKTEAKTKGSKKIAPICYAEDVSQPLSEKSQMYHDFGDQSGPAPKKKLTTREFVPSCEVEVRSPLKAAPVQSAVLIKSNKKSDPKLPTVRTPLGTSPKRKESKADMVTSRNHEPSTARVSNDNLNASPKKLPAKCSSRTAGAVKKETPKNKTPVLKQKDDEKEIKKQSLAKIQSKTAINKATSKPCSDKKSKERTVTKKEKSKESSKKVTERTAATENDEKKKKEPKGEKKKESKKEQKGTKEKTKAGGSSKKGRSGRKEESGKKEKSSKKGKKEGKKGESTKKTESDETGGSGQDKSARTQGETVASSKGF